jgi:chorismate mutase
MDLQALRGKLDVLDEEMMGILSKRFEVCKKVWKHKKEKNLPINDSGREAEVIKSKVEKSYLHPPFVEKLFSSIFEESKRLQGEVK